MRYRYTLFLMLLLTHLYAQQPVPSESDMAAYLMVYFKDDTHSVHFALSKDGYTFSDVNQGNPVIAGDSIAEQKGIRDPYITRGPDGYFYMAMTDLHIFGQQKGYRSTEWERDGREFGWGNNKNLVLMKSPDLIHWTHTLIAVDQAFPGWEGIGCAWAPQLIYDEQNEQMMVYFTLRFRNGLSQMYYSFLNKECTAMDSPPRLLFQHPQYNIANIDGDITRVNDQFHLFYVSHDGIPGIKQAVSNSLVGAYAYDPSWYDPEPQACEAPTVWKRIGEEKWVLMYDIYGINPHNFGFSETQDFKTFTNLGRFNEGAMKTTNFVSPKHGAVIHLTAAEATQLENYWQHES
ncbi:MULTISPECIES: glycoside hydrolase family 43 protein [Sphingobacterium]|uniref:Glycoside hydrolase family 43 protein n=1 Tax=Sphingobacterium populi TaxID=1812824 RepID=A0ABW5UFF5_9SPHI|nr:glycoside hydrolase family 43 protein [Sphingobacterium sp. CFCC 11742]